MLNQNQQSDLFCLDCGRVGHNYRGCERCASRALYPVQYWLERRPAPEEHRETGIERYYREEQERNRQVQELEKLFDR